jgi:SWI/SNF-related matrix-associated actin-dependent regulator of chromatin subfamily B protein 1
MCIELDLQLPNGGSRLHDTFEWDISNPDNCPLHFAKVLLQEELLDSPDNVNVVANEIRRKIETYCSQLSLNLHKNIEACVEEMSVNDDEDSEDVIQEAAFADFQMP